MSSLSDYWIFRSEFTKSYAVFVFITYVMAIGHRLPYKIVISKESGRIHTIDLLSTISSSGQMILCEATPFRLTPNLQSFIGALGLEGPFLATIQSVASSLTQPEAAFEDYLNLTIRDEMYTWYQNQELCNNRNGPMESPPVLKSDMSDSEEDIRSKTRQNVDFIIKRAQTFACLKEMSVVQHLIGTENEHNYGPIFQSILDLINCAVNPQKLCQMDAYSHPWF